jgi:beta-galactosidase
VVRLDAGADSNKFAHLRAELALGELTLKMSGALIQVRHPRFSVQLDRRTGQLQILGSTGIILADGVGPHAGRKLTLAEQSRSRKTPIWPGDLLRHARELRADAHQTAEGIRLEVRGKYPRPNAPEELLEGEYSLLVTRTGTMEISYNYTPVNATGTFVEAGLAMLMPATFSEFRWIGQGPFAAYPGKDRLNEFGIYHLNHEDIRFEGNRREVELAVLSNPAGDGLLIAGAHMDIAVENTSAGLVLSHKALVSGRGNKGGDPETEFRAGDIKRITGKLTLSPLTGDWPASLAAWFGPPSRPAALQKPFYHSYDQ